jgi:hypothetical protein
VLTCDGNRRLGVTREVGKAAWALLRLGDARDQLHRAFYACFRRCIQDAPHDEDARRHLLRHRHGGAADHACCCVHNFKERQRLHDLKRMFHRLQSHARMFSQQNRAFKSEFHWHSVVYSRVKDHWQSGLQRVGGKVTK